MDLRRLQTIAWGVTAAAALLALLAGVGHSPLPGGRGWLWAGYPLVTVLGVALGAVTARRHREIDRRRWEVVEDSSLTKGERQWAHEEAERERRLAGVAFVSAVVLLAGWMAAQGRPPGDQRALLADLLPVAALLAFGGGFLVAERRVGDDR